MTCQRDSILRTLTQEELDLLRTNRNNHDLIQSLKIIINCVKIFLARRSHYIKNY